jgi:hypothetical protein
LGFRKERQLDWMRLDSALIKSCPQYSSAQKVTETGVYKVSIFFFSTVQYTPSVSTIKLSGPTYSSQNVRLFGRTWEWILKDFFFTFLEKKKLTLCKHRFPCNTLTHSTNEDLLNIKHKCDPEVSYPLLYVRYRWNLEPVCNKSNFANLFYLYWYFQIY